MGAEKLLVHVKSSRPDYKRPADEGTLANKALAAAKTWDIVIIGGGSAGCVLASRLVATNQGIECKDRKISLIFVGSRNVQTYRCYFLKPGEGKAPDPVPN